jgi:hypothetical protein
METEQNKKCFEKVAQTFLFDFFCSEKFRSKYFCSKKISITNLFVQQNCAHKNVQKRNLFNFLSINIKCSCFKILKKSIRKRKGRKIEKSKETHKNREEPENQTRSPRLTNEEP